MTSYTSPCPAYFYDEAYKTHVCFRTGESCTKYNRMQDCDTALILIAKERRLKVSRLEQRAGEQK